jgi:hypothetical protein
MKKKYAQATRGGCRPGRGGPGAGIGAAAAMAAAARALDWESLVASGRQACTHRSPSEAGMTPRTPATNADPIHGVLRCLHNRAERDVAGILLCLR